MERPFFLYNRLTGEAMLFDEAVHGTKEQVGRQNPDLVDNPAKAGINMGDPSDEASVQKVKADFEAGRIPAIESPTFQSDVAQRQANEMERLRAENERLLRQNDDLLTEKRRHDELVQEERLQGWRDGHAQGLHSRELHQGAEIPAGEGEQDAGQQTGDPPQPLSVEDGIRLLPPKQAETDDPNWTNAGVPRVEALETVLGREISAGERDTAWTVVAPEFEKPAA